MDPFSGVVPFVHVAEERNFRRAAERLGVTTAAVSKAVAKLEADLGVSLLARTSRSVALTPEGEAYLARCREALSAIRDAREQVARTRGVAQGPLRVTVSAIIARVVVAELARFTQRHPQVTLHLSVTDRVAKLGEEEIDVAIRTGALDDSTLVARKLYAPRWVAVASPAYLARRGTPSTPEELMRHDTLRFVTPRGKPRAFAFTSGAVDTKGPLFVDNGDMLVHAALAGVGIAQVLDFMVDDALREGRLIEVLREHAVAGPTVHAVCASRRKNVPRVRAFLDFASELFR
jgi:LysR family transcriptional regulator, regulator for bpeEF and oprC